MSDHAYVYDYAHALENMTGHAYVYVYAYDHVSENTAGHAYIYVYVLTCKSSSGTSW